MDDFDLNRAKDAIEHFSDSQVFIISGNLKAAKGYRERILQHTNIAKKSQIILISNDKFSIDGLEFMDSIVFLCGYWWQNRNALKFMKSFIKLPKLVIPITYIPPLGSIEGGEKVGQEQKE